MDNNKIYELIQQQIEETEDGQYLNFTKGDISVSRNDNEVTFQIKGYEFKDILEEMKVAYVNNIKASEESAVALNVASLLDKADITLGENKK